MKKRGTVDKYMLLICILLVLNSKIFYLINIDALPIAFKDIALIAALFFECYVIFKLWRTKVYYRYNMFILAVIPLAVTSAYMSTKTYGQTFMMGILPQRDWIVWMFGYFPLIKLLRNQRITVDRVLAMMYKIAVIYLAIVTVQYLFPQLPILHVHSNIRYGEVRLYVGDSPIMLLAGYSLYQFLKKHSVQHALFFTWCVVLESVIMKGRAGTISMLVAVLICLFVEKNSINKKFLHFLFALIAGIIFLQTNMGQNLIATLQGREDLMTGHVRDVGRMLYLELLSKNWMTSLFGCGYANANWGPAVFYIMGSGRYQQEGLSILTADNGMYGFALYYGLIGIIWAVSMYLYCFKHAWKIYQNSGNFMFMFFLIWDFVGFQTLYFDCTYALLEFPVFLALLEVTYDKYVLHENYKGVFASENRVDYI